MLERRPLVYTRYKWECWAKLRLQGILLRAVMSGRYPVDLPTPLPHILFNLTPIRPLGTRTPLRLSDRIVVRPLLLPSSFASLLLLPSATMALQQEEEKVYAPKDALAATFRTTAATGGVGLFASAVQNTLLKQNVGPWGVFTRFGGTIGVFGTSLGRILTIPPRNLLDGGVDQTLEIICS
jgi:hypothetical protein